MRASGSVDSGPDRERQLFGEQALALKHGDLALSMSRSGVTAISPAERRMAAE